jgi:hypothetical protein
MTLFKNKLLPLLLALLMVVTMLPMTARAAEIPEETTTVCADEHCTHDHAEESPASEDMLTPETSEAPIPVDTPVVTEEIPEAPAVDELPAAEMPVQEDTESPEVPTEADAYSGYIGDSDVAWELDPASGRLFITGSGDCETFTSPEDQPWAAVRGEIKEVWFNSMDTLTIENLAYWFDGCTSLETAEVPYTTPVIGTRAFANCPSLYRLMLYYSDAPFAIAVGAFDSDILTPLEVDFIATSDTVTEILYAHDWSAENRAAYFEDVYSMMLLASGYCSSCKKTCGYTLDYEQWTSSIHCVRHWCSNCDYDQAGGVLGEAHTFSNGVCTKCGYDNGTGGGSGGGSVCYHTSTYTTWSGCNWYEYCQNCGALVDSGTSHGAYVYDDWEYYNSSRHRRYHYCFDCGQGSYEYGYHATSTNYSPYSATQHSVSGYCATCASTISTSYASHDFSYGSWQSYSGTQHRRLKTCSPCGYNEYEYASHSLTYGAWASISDTQHQRTSTCSCGYGTTETGAHSDADDNGYCDNCAYLMTRFSVTVPASLSLTVSEHGAVYAADNAAIVNNSTGAIAVTGVTVSTANGWTLVPFGSNMAAAKVDAKHIGFSLNSARSAITGTSENLSLPGVWTIAKGAALPLSYDAVVSAMSQPVSEQVLTVVFVLDWAA